MGALTKNKLGWIVQTDASIEERSYMKKILKELGLVDRLIVFENSSSTVEYFKNLMDTLGENTEEGDVEIQCYQPVPLLFLDINLPDNDSLKVVEKIKM